MANGYTMPTSLPASAATGPTTAVADSILRYVLDSPICVAIDTTSDWYVPPVGEGEIQTLTQEDFLTPDGIILGMPDSVGAPGDDSYIDHAVAVVGYVKDSVSPGGGYYIIKNSWGTDWPVGGGGFGYCTFYAVNRHNRITAITGGTSTTIRITSEPSPSLSASPLLSESVSPSVPELSPSTSVSPSP
jgi:hypothetical protein